TKPVETLLLKLAVRCFKYSLHVAVGSWTEELDCNVLLRRAMQSVPLIVRLVETGEVIKLTSECLSQALEAYGATVRKSSTKTQKIRAICKLGIVQQHVSQACVQTVLQTCEDLDLKRRKRSGSKSQQEDDGKEDSDEDELEEVQDLLIEKDPAWAAAEDLLEKLEQEERQRDDEQTSGAEMPVEASAATGSEDPRAGEAAAREEKSRRLLVTTSTIPEFLKERFAALEHVTMTHQVTKDKTLPHFQARLISGTHGGKILGITSEARFSCGRMF
ncbi:hemA, partial [Symbiodinium necroappetens]